VVGEGVINYHDELVPVVDAAAALGAESRDIGLGDHVIYFTAGGRRVAMVVAAVVDVETFNAEKVISAGEAGLPRRPFLGAYDQAGSIVRILEPAALLPDYAGAAEEAGGGE
jgi:chemotaxis signal transduction protein